MSDPAATSELFSDLRVQLKAAGVSDWSSFDAVTKRNPDLRTQLANATIAQIQANTTAAFEALDQISDSQALLTLVQEKPVVLTDGFLAGVEAVIAQAEAIGDASTAGRLRQRLADLRHIRAKMVEPPEPPVLLRTLMTFLKAENEAAARAVFAWAWVLLQSDEAQRILDEQFRGDTPQDMQHLTERRALLRQLRAADLSK